MAQHRRAAAALGAAGAAHAQDTLKKIKDSGSITMGVRESSGALAFTLGDGKYTGFHYDVCQRVIADIQKQLGMAKIDIKYQPVTSQNRIPLVQNGTVDLECGSTTNNATRQKDVDRWLIARRSAVQIRPPPPSSEQYPEAPPDRRGLVASGPVSNGCQTRCAATSPTPPRRGHRPRDPVLAR